jgi:hypothetical protein
MVVLSTADVERRRETMNYPMGANLNAVVRAAERVSLAVVVDPVARELYGVADPALDEHATLRRVALFFRGTGRYALTQDEQDAALGVIRGRFASTGSR